MEKRFHHRLLLDHTSEIQSNFDIFNLNTYDTFDFMLFGMSVVLLMLICFVLGWYLHKRCVHQKIFDNIEADIETLRCELSVTHAEHSKKVANILRHLGSPRTPFSNAPFTPQTPPLNFKSSDSLKKFVKIKLPNLKQYRNSRSSKLQHSNSTETRLTEEKMFDEMQLSIGKQLDIIMSDSEIVHRNSIASTLTKGKNINVDISNDIETPGNDIETPGNNIVTPGNNITSPTIASVLSPPSNMESETHIEVQITTENYNDNDNDNNPYSQIVNNRNLQTIRESFNGSIQFDC
eukprot:506332_1